MKISRLCALLSLLLLLCPALVLAAPLRVFIRSGEKTHGPGAHDYPSFLADWQHLLNERGATASGGMAFPTVEQLKDTDVLILHSEEAGNIELQDRKNLDVFLARGGGLVVLHGGAVSRDADWYRDVVGGSWRFGQTKWLEGPMSLYFTDRENPITTGCSNFDLTDEVYYDMDIRPEAKILAAAYTPKAKDGSLPQGRVDAVNIYDIQPQIWTYEREHYRAFVSLPGHLYKNFSHNSIRTILLRGIAWAGKRTNVDELCKPEELGMALRYPEGGPSRPEKAAEKMELHPEFSISLVAAEPLITKVLNMDWDEKGRLWVVETPEYPNGLRKANPDFWKDSGSLKPGQIERKPQDRISILSDEDGDGVMDRKHVFADGLELATSFVFYKRGVIVSSAPDIWFLEDTDGDQIADRRTKLYTGLGTFDTHAVMNNLRWGLDGWVYATHGYSRGDVSALGSEDKNPVNIASGVVRFRPDGSKIEMYSSRNGNCWGLDMTSDGQCFWTQPTSGTVLFHTVLPEFVLAQGGIPGTASWHGMIVQEKVHPKIHWEQQAYRQIDLVGSYTAAAGCAIYEGGAWPEKWNYSYFVGEPTVNIISQYFVKPDGVTYRAEREAGRENTEFLRSSDLWFRPVENRVGPDGALYVVDFCNQAVIHNDTRGPLHGPANAAVRPDRDHYFGRIWRIQHREAKKISTPEMDQSQPETLRSALKSPNGHTRQLAFRLLREAGQEIPSVKIGSTAYQAWEAHRKVKNEADRQQIREGFLRAQDDWTRSAYLAIAHQQPLEFLRDALMTKAEGKQEEALAQWAGLLTDAVLVGDKPEITAILQSLTEGPNRVTATGTTVLDHLSARRDLKVELSDSLTAQLLALATEPATASHVLPLVVRWDSGGRMKSKIADMAAELSETLQNTSAPVGDRIKVASLLARTDTEEAKKSLLTILTKEGENRELQESVVRELGENGSADILVRSWTRIVSRLRGQVFGEIVKRPEAALTLLDDIASGQVKHADLGPGNIARLRTHPDAAVAKRAGEMLDQLLPGTKEKGAIIAKLLPDVSKPGDAVKGRVLFEAACAVCHRYGDLGKLEVGPSLTGMGSHGVAELLSHIVDPNREVDPSFWQWNITLKNGDALAGVIVRENPSGFTLRNQGGDIEVKKEDVAKRENTFRSLMPEGLESLGVEGLRNLLSFLSAEDGRYRVVDLRNAYTADSRRGLFQSADTRNDSVFPVRFGNILSHEIPFYLMEAKTSTTGRNLVVLKGGREGAAAVGYPQKVTIPVNLPATRFYFLSGIAGWGFPAIRDARPVLKVTVTHQDGTREVTELKNGVEFADYNREIQVPGSILTEGVVSRGQARIITLPVRPGSAVKSMTLESYDNQISPVVMAITADLSAGASPVETVSKNDMKTAPKASAEKNSDLNALSSASAKIDLSKEAPTSIAATGMHFIEPRLTSDTIRVLLVGSGSSHHFPRDFIAADAALLRNQSKTDVAGTMNLDEALRLMPQADVLVFSGNHDQWGTAPFQKALHDFADAGKGMLFVHAATWSHPWEGYNQRFIQGGTKAHGRGEVTTDVAAIQHPVMKGLPETFQIADESYHFSFFKNSSATVLAVNRPDGKSPESHPALWVVKDSKARIVCYTHGHDDASHDNPNYRLILENAVRWVSERH